MTAGALLHLPFHSVAQAGAAPVRGMKKKRKSSDGDVLKNVCSSAHIPLLKASHRAMLTDSEARHVLLQ
jgi:hypothetical protein